jgi:hypothetical protein
MTEGTNLVLTYAATPGYTYRIESAPIPTPVSWAMVPGSTTNATTNVVTFSFQVVPGESQRFYRTASP